MSDDKGSVLIVEDTPREGTELQAAFESRGYRAKWVPNKELAVAELQGEQFFVAMLADVHLGPNEDALDLTFKAVKDFPMSYIVCMSGYENSPLIPDAREVCDFYTNKPVDIDVVADMIEREGRIKRRKMTEQYKRASIILGDVSDENALNDDTVSLEAHKAEREELMKKHLGKYAAYLAGKLVGTDSSKLKLIQDVYKKYHRSNILIVKLEENHKPLQNVSARKNR